MSDAIIRTGQFENRTETIYNYVDRYINRYVNVNYNLTTEIITSNQVWTVPEHAGNIYVRIFGGGGSGSTEFVSGFGGYGGGGGGGWMNNGEFYIDAGQSIPITIGIGGNGRKGGESGGTTSFGTYLSAAGGTYPTILSSKFIDGAYYFFL